MCVHYSLKMAEIIRQVIKCYKYIFTEITDPRTENWLLIAKPYQCLVLLGVYLMFIYKWGPLWMKHRPAFNIDRLLIAYNAIQIIMCASLFLQSLRFWGWGGKYRWICEPVDFTNSEDGLLMAKLTYYYFLLKVFDLFDTVSFVLRKKFNQVSFLHVYHHTGMVLLIWGAVTYYPGGHGSLVGVINCFVHTVMYCYYLLTIALPNIKNEIWFKKLVTRLQIIQFFIFVVHMVTLIFKPDCQYPRWISALFLPQNLFMLILFIDFYIKTYIRKPKYNKTEERIINNKVTAEPIYVKNGNIVLNDGNDDFIFEHNSTNFRARNVEYNYVER